MTSDVQILNASNGATVCMLRPAVREYCKTIYPNSWKAAADWMMKDLFSSAGDDDHLIAMVLDTASGRVIAFVHAMDVDNYGTKKLFIADIWSSVAGWGKTLYRYARKWGKSRECTKVCGAVPVSRAAAAMELWKLQPDKVLLEGDL